MRGTAAAQSSKARLLVYKNPTPERPVGSPTPPFEAITHSGIANAGFSQIAEYTARTLYDGPASAAPTLIEELKAAGYHAEIATELDSVLFNDYLFDADTGTTTPAVPTSEHRPVAKDGLYVLALRGYPTGPWLADLESRNVRIVEALPPAGYLVRGERSRMPTLKGQASYVRGVFPFTPGMKKVLFGSGTHPAAVRQVAIHAYEEAESESLTAYLSSIDDKMAVERTGGHSRYHASLSDVDIETLTAFETVYSISPIGEPMLSSERQGVLVLQPTVVSGRLELPGVTPGYTGILVAKNISNFSNTRIGMVDSGFDNGQMTGGSPIHPDFTSPAFIECTDPNPSLCDDDTTHGTVVASVIAGWPPAGTRQDIQSYRWGLGLAPAARLVVH